MSQNLSLDQYENLVRAAGDEHRVMMNRLINSYKRDIENLKKENEMLKKNQIQKEPKKS